VISLGLILPEDDFIHQDICTLGRVFEELALSHAAVRDGTKRIWQLSWFFDTPPDLTLLSDSINTTLQTLSKKPRITEDDWTHTDIADDTDWLRAVYAQNPPVRVDPFFIYGSHNDGKIPNDLIALNIDAITAFGSGDHGTTRGCLAAMAKLKDDGVCPWNVLDMGTGSGILAIAAWKLWKTPVLGVDIEAEAITVCHRHAAQNKIDVAPQDLTFMHGDGFQTPLVQDKKPFDLIIANILAGPLKDMARDMYAVCDDLGYIILSGILNEQTADVLDIYTAAGFIPRAHDEIGEWSTIVMQK
jgi:ribosomal protein L11 methyltransferase